MKCDDVIFKAKAHYYIHTYMRRIISNDFIQQPVNARAFVYITDTLSEPRTKVWWTGFVVHAILVVSNKTAIKRIFLIRK